MVDTQRACSEKLAKFQQLMATKSASSLGEANCSKCIIIGWPCVSAILINWKQNFVWMFRECGKMRRPYIGASECGQSSLYSTCTPCGQLSLFWYSLHYQHFNHVFLSFAHKWRLT